MQSLVLKHPTDAEWFNNGKRICTSWNLKLLTKHEENQKSLVQQLIKKLKNQKNPKVIDIDIFSPKLKVTQKLPFTSVRYFTVNCSKVRLCESSHLYWLKTSIYEEMVVESILKPNAVLKLIRMWIFSLLVHFFPLFSFSSDASLSHVHR